MDFNKVDLVANILKCLSHKDRLKIVCFLLEEERTVNEIMELVGLKQSQTSQFLKILKDGNIIDSKKIVREGVALQCYFIKDKNIHALISVMKKHYC